MTNTEWISWFFHAETYPLSAPVGLSVFLLSAIGFISIGIASKKWKVSLWGIAILVFLAITINDVSNFSGFYS